MYVDAPWMSLGGLRGSRRDRDPIGADASLVTLDGDGLARRHVTLTATAMGLGWPLAEPWSSGECTGGVGGAGDVHCTVVLVSGECHVAFGK